MADPVTMPTELAAVDRDYLGQYIVCIPGEAEPDRFRHRMAADQRAWTYGQEDSADRAHQLDSKLDFDRCHYLKIRSVWFDAVASGLKRCEIRYNDRDFEVGDGICLCEIKTIKVTSRTEYGLSAEEGTGRWASAVIEAVITDGRADGLERGWCMLCIRIVSVQGR